MPHVDNPLRETSTQAVSTVARKRRPRTSTTQPDAARAALGRHRSAVLSYLFKLNKCIDARHADLVHAVATRFSETLIDYVSFGHFRLFQTWPPEDHHLAAIENSTNQALGFSDRFTSPRIDLDALRKELETLALALEVRFEIEDEVVGACL